MNNNLKLIFLAGGTLAVSCANQAEKQKQPNILFIMSDDHAFQAISAYGHGLNKTPNIDRIAKEGAIFTKAFVTNSLCAPSRAVLLTGKHSFMNGKIDNFRVFDWNQENFPKLLQKGGYQTALIGKIHLDGKPQGFDYSMVSTGSYYNPGFIINGSERKQINGYCTEIITDAVIDWIDKRDQDKPFCVLYHNTAPHRNWVASPKHMALYEDTTFIPPASFFDNYEGRGTAAREQEMQIDGHAMWDWDFKLMVDPDGKPTGFERSVLGGLTPEQKVRWMEVYEPIYKDFHEKKPKGKDLALWKYNRFIKDYLKVVRSVDDGVGDVLDYLKKSGLDKNTIVIYTSDQGFFLGEHGWFDKRFMYEESFRTPLLMKYPPEIKPGTVVDKMVQNLDFASTFLDYAGVEIPKEIQGESFRKIASGKKSEWRDAVYYTFYEYPAEHAVKRHHGIRTDRYKLIHFYYDVDEWELYDLQNDPQEMKSVYNDPAYAEAQKTMHAKLIEIRKKYGDSDEMDQSFLQSVKK